MAKELLINVSEGEECRIALVEDGALEELYMERTSSTSHVGNVYKGKVMNVEPSIQAAFVDFGLGRNGFLHISDLLPSYFGRKGDDVQEFVGKKMARRDRPPIQRCLRRGDEIVVQVIKEGIGTKGPTLSAYLSISGKMLVMMPGVNGRGVSRKIEDEDERRRLKQILDQLDPPEDCGFIIRTESVGKSKAEIERDLKYLARLWDQIKKKRDGTPAPVELYTEGDLVTRTVRDVFSSDVDQIVIDNKEVARRVKEVIKLSNPRARNKVDLYEGPLPLFHKYGIEREIEQMYSRHVPLRSGGSLVIDSTEAIVAIDVNSGKFRDHSDAETTAFKTDMEAADEICRQLKLRDLGGVIICDFIDLRFDRHRRELEERLHENLKRDRAKTKVLRMSQFGIIEMTRQRMRPSLKRSVYFDCPHCKGAGLVKTPESMSLDVMRRLAIGIHDQRVVRVELSVNPDVSFYLLNKKRESLARLEYDTGRKILIRSDATLGLDEMRLELFDNREGVVVIPELSSLQQVPHKTQLNTRPAGQFPQRGGRQQQGRGDNRQNQRQQQPPRQGPRRGEQRDDFDRDADAMEERADKFDREEDFDSEPATADETPSQARGPETDREPQRDEESFDNQRNNGRQPDNRGVDNRGVDNRGYDDQGGEGGGKRRRRRRRRRGRGRGGQHEFQEGQAGPQGGDRRPPFQGRDNQRDDRPLQEPVGGQHDWDDRDRENHEREDHLDREPVGEPYEDESGPRDEERGHDEPDMRDVPFGEEMVDSERGELPREETPPAPASEALVEAPEPQVEEEKPAKRGRQRGSRGGRGRGKKKTAESATPVAKEKPAPKAKEDEPAEPKPKRRRGSRGGKGRKRAGAANASAEGSVTAKQSSPNPTPASLRQPNIESPPIVRTGSTDRHLADEEPVLHEPVRRPRSYRDLDHIPDDYD